MNSFFSCRLTYFFLLSRKLNLVPGSALVFLYANFTQLLLHGASCTKLYLCAAATIMVPIAMQVFRISKTIRRNGNLPLFMSVWTCHSKMKRKVKGPENVTVAPCLFDYQRLWACRSTFAWLHAKIFCKNTGHIYWRSQGLDIAVFICTYTLTRTSQGDA